MAHAQELRDALFHLRQAGKRVLCHLEDGDGSSLYLCSAADRILLNPAGGIRFAGLKSRYMYFGGLLEKLGIKADFVRIGDHKSAPESFMRNDATDVARADHIDLLQQVEKNFTLDVAAGRHIDAVELRKRIAKGPFVASEAKFAGLVDGFAFDDQLEDEVSAAGRLARAIVRRSTRAARARILRRRPGHRHHLRRRRHGRRSQSDHPAFGHALGRLLHDRREPEESP